MERGFVLTVGLLLAVAMFAGNFESEISGMQPAGFEFNPDGSVVKISPEEIENGQMESNFEDCQNEQDYMDCFNCCNKIVNENDPILKKMQQFCFLLSRNGIISQAQSARCFHAVGNMRKTLANEAGSCRSSFASKLPPIISLN